MKGWLGIILFVLMLAISACNDKLICPAYQSYFILDNTNYPREGYPNDRSQGLATSRFSYPDMSNHLIENPIRDEYFSYIDTDSFPKMVEVSKNQYGIITEKRLRARDRAMQTIPMEVVIPQAPDSLIYAGDEELFTELDLVDSLAIDSIRSLGKSYQYNLDQKYYLWYMRNKLVWKDELGGDATKETEGESPEGESATSDDAGAGKQGFFKRIFGNLFKKKGTQTDPAVDEAPTESTEEDPKDGF